MSNLQFYLWIGIPGLTLLILMARFDRMDAWFDRLESRLDRFSNKLRDLETP